MSLFLSLPKQLFSYCRKGKFPPKNSEFFALSCLCNLISSKSLLVTLDDTALLTENLWCFGAIALATAEGVSNHRTRSTWYSTAQRSRCRSRGRPTSEVVWWWLRIFFESEDIFSGVPVVGFLHHICTCMSHVRSIKLRHFCGKARKGIPSICTVTSFSAFPTHHHMVVDVNESWLILYGWAHLDQPCWFAYQQCSFRFGCPFPKSCFLNVGQVPPKNNEFFALSCLCNLISSKSLLVTLDDTALLTENLWCFGAITLATAEGVSNHRTRSTWYSTAQRSRCRSRGSVRFRWVVASTCLDEYCSQTCRRCSSCLQIWTRRK